MNEETLETQTCLLTVAAGKRLIAKAVAHLPAVEQALKNRTILVLGGTTNAYVAQELLKITGQADGFRADTFFRGVTTPPGHPVKKAGAGFEGDVVLEKGKLIKGKTVFDVAPGLKQGDVIVKGANAVNAQRTLAGILIGNPAIGTSAPIIQAAAGRRVELILPVGLEKRVLGDIGALAAKLNSPRAVGPRLLPVCGTIVTELEALEMLTGARAELVAAGGINGAEGSCWIAVTGTKVQLSRAKELLHDVVEEPPFEA